MSGSILSSRDSWAVLQLCLEWKDDCRKVSTALVPTMWCEVRVSDSGECVRMLSCGMWCCVVYYKGTSVLDEPAALIFRVQDEGRQQALVKYWYLCTRLYGITSQKTVILESAVVQDWTLVCAILSKIYIIVVAAKTVFIFWDGAVVIKASCTCTGAFFFLNDIIQHCTVGIVRVMACCKLIATVWVCHELGSTLKC